MTITSAELSRKRAEAGRAGGYATFLNYPREQRVAWARKGGRPRSKTLEELMEQHGGSATNEKRRELPGITEGLKLSRLALSLVRDTNKDGEAAGYQTEASPEGAMG